MPSADAPAPTDAIHLAMVVLLCSDCCALIVGRIDDDEWRRRVADPPSHAALSALPSPS